MVVGPGIEALTSQKDLSISADEASSEGGREHSFCQP